MKSDRKKRKRRKYLLKLYPVLIKMGLIPFVAGIAWGGNMLVDVGIVNAVVGADNLVLIGGIAYLLLVYLLIYPVYYWLKGLQLFGWNWVYWIQSLKGTFYTRYSLFKQLSRVDTDRVIRDFNHAVKRLTLSVLDDSIELMIPLPKVVDAQQMLNDQEDAIRERIGLIFPEYAFSSFERQGMTLVLTGSR
ncbi:hypothetical protein [Levilactobacillus cerevisiae]|uniref:hypothetical protein n=1 Tax=Levilactobacillus cerevisiae TaxID=1704076 RepID=UPI000F78DA7F|nr:hypothetical protein [Levilactobacillus cerevisiae]